MPRLSPRFVAACACLLAAVAAWLTVAALLDARQPGDLYGGATVIGSVTFTGGVGDIAWWTLAAAAMPLATLGLAMLAAGAAAWARLGDAARVPATIALAVVALVSAAVVIVGVGAVAVYAAGPSVDTTSPDVYVAKLAAMVLGGLMFLAGSVAAAAPSRAAPRPMHTITPRSRALAGGGMALALVLAGGGIELVDRTAHHADAGRFTVLRIDEHSRQVAPPVTARAADPLTTALGSRAVSDYTYGVCMDDSTDVARTHAPENCLSHGATVTLQDGASNAVEVDDYASPREAAYQYGVHLRYMRQYGGNRLDRAVPGIANSRMIHTGDSGELFTVVVRVRAKLVIELVSAAGLTEPLSKADMDDAVALAHKLVGVLNS